MRRFQNVAFIALLAIIWELLGRSGWSTNLPPFSAVASRVQEQGKLLLASSIATCARALLGLFLAIITGIMIGVWISLSVTADRLFSPVIDFLRPLPSSALIVLLALWVDLWDIPWMIVWFGCTWPILLNTRDRMRTLPPEIAETLNLLELTVGDRLRYVYSRALLPGILSGIRVSLGIAIILAITVELVIPPTSFFGIPHTAWNVSTADASIPWGIGSYLLYYNSNFEVLPLYAGVLVAGIVGLLLNRLYQQAYILILERNHLLNSDSSHA